MISSKKSATFSDHALTGKDFKKSQNQSLILSQNCAIPKIPRRTSRRLVKVHMHRASIVPKRFTFMSTHPYHGTFSAIVNILCQ